MLPYQMYIRVKVLLVSLVHIQQNKKRMTFPEMLLFKVIVF